MDENSEKLTDRELHCLVRTIQDMLSEEGRKCLYCKYAFQCAERHKTTGKVKFLETWDKLQEMTGVKLRFLNPRTMSKDILAGSWIEKIPELYEKFSNMPLEEQLGTLQDKDILKYADKCRSAI